MAAEIPKVYAPRTIAFVCELFHPLHDPEPLVVQKVHNQLFQAGDPAYKCFAITPAGAVLSNPVARPGEVSSAAFLADRFQFREELSGLTVEEFAQRVRHIAELVGGLFHVQVFTAQQVTVRTLVNPRSFKDSRTFLKEGMFGFRDEVADFGRDPQLYGIRLVFPPSEGQPNSYSLRIESFHNDARSLFIENQATFAPLLRERGLEEIERNVLDAYAFLVERSLAFVARFDARQEAP